MYFLWAIGVLTLITMWIVNSSTTLPSEAESSSISDAQKMYAYHESALDACINTAGLCTVEMVLPSANVRAEMATSVQGGVDFNNDKFISYITAAGDLITVHRDLNSILALPVNQEKTVNKATEVSKHLGNLIGYGGIAGSYNLTDQEILDKFGRTYVLPPAIAGDNIADMAPIVATERTW